jgi:hypothetical protein
MKAILVALAGMLASTSQAEPARSDVEAAMHRATQFMVEKVSYRGGYLWNYLPDMSRRWGEMEARETMIWLQATCSSMPTTRPATSITTVRPSRSRRR